MLIGARTRLFVVISSHWLFVIAASHQLGQVASFVQKIIVHGAMQLAISEVKDLQACRIVLRTFALGVSVYVYLELSIQRGSGRIPISSGSSIIDHRAYPSALRYHRA